MLQINTDDRHIIMERLPFLFATSGSLPHLFGLVDFSGNWVQSIALTVVYCSVHFVEVCLIAIRKKITDSELKVYGVMLVSSFIIAVIYLQDRYTSRKDSTQDFIIKMLCLVVAIVGGVFHIANDRVRMVESYNSSVV